MIRSSFFYIGLFSLLISIFSFFNIIYSYYFNLYLNLDSYIYSLIISLFFGFLFTFKKKNGFKISIYEKIIIVLMGYLLLPLFIATYPSGFVTLYPFFVSIEMTPKIAFAPLFISWFGFGLMPKVIIGFKQ